MGDEHYALIEMQSVQGFAQTTRQMDFLPWRGKHVQLTRNARDVVFNRYSIRAEFCLSTRV
jgi:hypothetical protein